MDQNIDLKNIANRVREEMSDDPKFVQEHDAEISKIENHAPVDPSTEYHGPGVVNFGTKPVIPQNAPKPSNEGLEGVDLSAKTPNAPAHQPITTGLTDEDLRSTMPDVDDEEFKRLLPNHKLKLNEYQKSLVMQGFTPSEALEATKNRAAKEGAQINADWLDKHPKRVDIVIDKSQVNDLEFSEEEKNKLHIAPTVRLVVVEDKDLSTLPVEKVDIKHKVTYLNSIRSGLSKYSVPLPCTGDFLTFRGAQLVELLSCVNYDDDKIIETMMRKAEVVYDKLMGGTLMQKYDEKGEIALTFDDFCNKVAYVDLDMCLYGVVCASNMEESETYMECSKCGHKWPHKYNTKQLLSQDGFGDFFKERAEQVLKARGDDRAMAELNKFMHTSTRYKSPYTNNVYEIEVPTIAKVSRASKGLDSEDPQQKYIAALAMFIHTLYVWNEENQKYIELGSSDDEMDLLLDTLSMIPDSDVKILQEQAVNKLAYSTYVKMSLTCPNCGVHSDIPMNVERLVFQKAQDFSEAIQ